MKSKSLRVQNTNNKLVYKVVGTYFNSKEGEGKVYLQDKNGIDESVTLSFFLGNFKVIYEEKGIQPPKPLDLSSILRGKKPSYVVNEIDAYTLLNAPTPMKLEEQIRYMLKEGWGLLGSIVTVTEDGCAYYLQAMVGFRGTNYTPENKLKLSQIY